MESDTGLRASILDTLIRKSNLKQEIYDHTFAVLGQMKEHLLELASEIDDELEGRLDKRVRIEYRDRGKFEAQIQIAGEMLIFTMHTDVFDFGPGHPLWQNPYVADHPDNAFCGMINIYNFLSDSFRYNRNGDEGYLVGRLFVNRECSFLVEGLRLPAYGWEHFGEARIDRDAVRRVLEAAVEYALSFDLLVPPYDKVKLATVDQFNTKMENSKFRTGKRLGYDFRVEDI